jgi:hypothetical protein
LAAIAYGYAAVLNFIHDKSVVMAERLHVPVSWMVRLGALLGAGSLGLLAGFAVPGLGTTHDGTERNRLEAKLWLVQRWRVRGRRIGGGGHPPHTTFLCVCSRIVSRKDIGQTDVVLQIPGEGFRADGG